MGVVVWGPTWDLVPPSLASASLTPVIMFRSLRVATWTCSSLLTENRAPAGPLPARLSAPHREPPGAFSTWPGQLLLQAEGGSRGLDASLLPHPSSALSTGRASVNTACGHSQGPHEAQALGALTGSPLAAARGSGPKGSPAASHRGASLALHVWGPSCLRSLRLGLELRPSKLETRDLRNRWLGVWHRAGDMFGGSAHAPQAYKAAVT